MCPVSNIERVIIINPGEKMRLWKGGLCAVLVNKWMSQGCMSYGKILHKEYMGL